MSIRPTENQLRFWKRIHHSETLFSFDYYRYVNNFQNKSETNIETVKENSFHVLLFFLKVFGPNSLINFDLPIFDLNQCETVIITTRQYLDASFISFRTLIIRLIANDWFFSKQPTEAIQTTRLFQIRYTIDLNQVYLILFLQSNEGSRSVNARSCSNFMFLFITIVK